MFDKVRERLARASTMLTPDSRRDSDLTPPPKKTCQQLPKIVIPDNIKVRDDIDRAMVEYSDCPSEDSPTWVSQSPFSLSLSWNGANGIKEIEDLINGTTRSADGTPLGLSKHPCVWTKAMVGKLDACYVVREARRRVRKWYHDKHERLQRDVERELAKHRAQHPRRPVPRALQAKRRELEALRAALDERLVEEKEEATRRVVPLILPALSASTQSAVARKWRRGTF